MSDIIAIMFAVAAIGVLLWVWCGLRRTMREYAECCAALELEREWLARHIQEVKA